MRIFLIGFMGCGKSTIGKEVAKKMHLAFIDLDDYIVKKEKSNIQQIFEEYGEDYFRKIEKKSLLEICEKDNLVVATGGGTPCFLKNMQIILEKGTSVYLKMEAYDLFERLASQQNKRPLLKNKSKEELLDFINLSLSKRESFYKQANLIVNTKNIESKDIIEIIS